VHHRNVVFVVALGAAALAGSIAGRAEASTTSAWAVGFYRHGSNDRTLIEFSTGSSWTIQPSPNVGSDDSFLRAVTATLRDNAWAVGGHYGTHRQTLILRWDGLTWSRQLSPNVGSGDNDLNAVAANSDTDAWAVGEYDGGDHDQSLILHWNGSDWYKQPSPSPGTFFNELTGVVAISPNNAWAVGFYGDTSSSVPLLLHWDGRKWSQVQSPHHGSSDEIWGVSAVSGNDIWAVGDYTAPSMRYRTLMLHRTASGWSALPSVNGRTDYEDKLVGVAATSSTNVWALVAARKPYDQGSLPDLIRILHWNGSKWQFQAVPQKGVYGFDYPSAIVASSASGAWAVGDYSNGAAYRTLVLHWGGTKWKVQTSKNVGSGDNFLEGVAATTK
jgi:hypothetical protein